MPPRSRAFTVMELIVVVLILVALAAVMTPVFLHTRGENIRKVCLERFSRVGSALLLYTYDFDDSLPMARYDPAEKTRHTLFFASGPSGPGPVMWADLVVPYAKNFSVFTCPSDALDAPNPGRMQGYPLSFALNTYFYDQPGVQRETSTGGAVGEIANASSKILLTESASRAGHEIMRPDMWKAPDGSAIWERHAGNANWIYGDLHSESHAMPEAWKHAATSDWKDPLRAGSQDYPQWFPWLKSTAQRW